VALSRLQVKLSILRQLSSSPTTQCVAQDEVKTACSRTSCNVQVCKHEDTLLVEEFVWSIPSPAPGQKYRPIPPRFEPLLYIPSTKSTRAAANVVAVKPILKTGTVNHQEVCRIDFQKNLVLTELFTIELCIW
jgi:hypothetical protein